MTVTDEAGQLTAVAEYRSSKSLKTATNQAGTVVRRKSATGRTLQANEFAFELVQ